MSRLNIVLKVETYNSLEKFLMELMGKKACLKLPSMMPLAPYWISMEGVKWDDEGGRA